MVPGLLVWLFVLLPLVCVFVVMFYYLLLTLLFVGEYDIVCLLMLW